MLAALTTVAAAGLACDSVPLTAPSGTAITLIPGTNLLSPDGSTDIIAILIEGGQFTTGIGNNDATTTGLGTPVHNGTVVNFTTTLGTIEPAEAKTTSGRVTVRLVADGRSGTAVVTAFSGAAIQTIEITIGTGAAASTSR